MYDVFYKSIDEIPEQHRENFVESEFEGQKGYQHKKVVALAQAYRKEHERRSGLEGVLAEKDSAAKALLAEKEAQFRAELETKLQEAESKADVKKAREIFEQQMADAVKRAKEEAREEVTKELTSKQAEQQASAQADKLGAMLGVDKESGEALADLIRHRVKVDPETGKRIYHDAKGSALSVDDNGFIEELKKEARLKRLIKAEVPTNGGGFANGNGGNGGNAPDANSRADAAKKKGDLNGFLKAHLTP